MGYIIDQGAEMPKNHRSDGPFTSQTLVDARIASDETI